MEEKTIYGQNQYKFMTNIIQGPMQQTRYMKSLEKITMDAQVSYQQLIFGLVFMLVAVIIYISTGVFVGSKFAYVFIPATIIFASLSILVINYLISSRSKPMLYTAGKLALHPYFENIRLRSKKLGNLKSVGIKSFKKGVITFKNGDKGLLYEIAGQLSLSTLPGTADAIANARAQYLMARTPDSQEQLLVSIKHMDTRPQLMNLNNYFKQDTGDINRDYWTKAMALQIGNYINEYINDDFTIGECIIIREKNLAQLKKLKTIFEQSANGGLYASAVLITDINKVIELMSPLTLLSRKGKKLNASKQ